MRGLSELANRAKATARITVRHLAGSEEYTITGRQSRNAANAPASNPEHPFVRLRQSLGDRLCDRCACFGDYQYSPTRPLSREWYASTASRGCSRCTAISRAVDLICPGWTHESAGTVKVSICWLRWYEIYIEHTGWYLMFVPEMMPAPPGLDEWKWPTTGGGVCTDTSTLEAFRLARKWLEKCVQSHSKCKPPDPTFMPRRLVKVSCEDDQDMSIHLVENVDNPHPYAALSYCRGTTTNTFKTTRARLEAFKKCIQIDSMPKTFRDAVIACRHLRIEYLWIDSLCILHDDDHQKDWHEASNEARHIFPNAHVTISADGANHVDQGFLGSQKFASPRFKTRWSDGSEYVLGIKPVLGSHPLDSFPLSLLPLSTRAWALQEALLSPRILHYTGQEMVWDCLDSCQCECNRHFRNPQRDLFAAVFHSPDPNIVFPAWHSLVAHFSSLTLGNPAEKLSALSALASTVQHNLGAAKTGAYLAGIWEADLLPSLLWNVRGPGRPRRARTYRAPSWSWASIDGRVEFFGTPLRSLPFKRAVCVESVCCPPFSPLDPTGAVAAVLEDRGSSSMVRSSAGDGMSASIELTGLLVEVALEVAGAPLKGHKSAYERMHTGTGTGALAALQQHAFVRTQLSEPYEVLCDESMPFSDGPVGLGPGLDGEFFCLLVGTLFEGQQCALLRGSGGRPGSRIWWLVLRKSWRVKGALERVGMGFCSSVQGELSCGLFDDVPERRVMLV